MLTVKAPIKLHIDQGLTGGAESFSERIRGNYDLMGAHFAPKDLLFLLTAPPELPEDFGGMTTLVDQNNRVDVQNVTIEAVNNVVNRILLDGTPQFTYQDQVYITNVLNRLGVTNTAQFMEQVRSLRTENQSTVHMTKLYRTELERVLQRQLTGQEVPKLPLPAPAGEEKQPPAQDPRVTLCMSILNRLDTANIYETVHSFQRSWSSQSNVFRSQELRLSEQLRFQNTVALAQLKQQVYQQPQLHLTHHLNQYETTLLTQPPKNEEEVLSQAAAAALLNAVDNTVVEVLNRPQLLRAQWVRVDRALWQTAENSLTRFEQYHTLAALPPSREETAPGAVWNTYAQELKEYQTLYWKMYPKAAELAARRAPEAQGGSLSLQHITQEGDTDAGLEQHLHLTTEQRTAFQRDTAFQTQWTRTLREVLGQYTQEHPNAAASLTEEQLTYLNQVREGDVDDHTEQHLHLVEEESAVLRDTERRTQRTERLREVLRQYDREHPGAVPQLTEEQLTYLSETREGDLLLSQAATVPTERIFRESREHVERTERTDALRETLRKRETVSRKTAETVRRTERLRELLRQYEREHPGAIPPLTTEELTYLSQTAEGDLLFQQEGEPSVLEERELLRERQEERTEGRDMQRETLRERETVSRETPESPLPEHETKKLREIIRQQLQQSAAPAAQREQVPFVQAPQGEEESVEETLPTQLAETPAAAGRDATRETTRELSETAIRELLRQVERTSIGAPTAVTTTERHTREQLLAWETFLRQEGAALFKEQEQQTLLRELAAHPERFTAVTPSVESARTIFRQELEQTRLEHLRENTERLTETGQETAVPAAEPEETPQTARFVPPSPPAVEPMVLTPREAEEVAPQILERELTRIDQRNRMLERTIKQESQRTVAQPIQGADIPRTMRDSLRALEEPELVLREIQTAAEREAARTDGLTPGEEMILNHVKPEERALYEAIFSYQRDPEGTMAKGLLRPGSPGMLNAQLQQLELEHPAQEETGTADQPETQPGTEVRERSETVLERLLHTSVQQGTAEVQPPSAVKFVHKQAQPDVTEELLEQLEQQRTRSTIRTDTQEEVTHRQTRQTDVSQVEKTMVAQTTEDITELVNRTLARQMRTISDQVYRQMEKKLQVERSRRGRL